MTQATPAACEVGIVQLLVRKKAAEEHEHPSNSHLIPLHDVTHQQSDHHPYEEKIGVVQGE